MSEAKTSVTFLLFQAKIQRQNKKCDHVIILNQEVR